MSPQSKQEYFEALYKRYKGASRKEKTIIIDECCAIFGYNRKHAIRRLKWWLPSCRSEYLFSGYGPIHGRSPLPVHPCLKSPVFQRSRPWRHDAHYVLSQRRWGSIVDDIDLGHGNLRPLRQIFNYCKKDG